MVQFKDTIFEDYSLFMVTVLPLRTTSFREVLKNGATKTLKLKVLKELEPFVTNMFFSHGDLKVRHCQ